MKTKYPNLFTVNAPKIKLSYLVILGDDDDIEDTKLSIQTDNASASLSTEDISVTLVNVESSLFVKDMFEEGLKSFELNQRDLA
tara:strand:+ start:333 stop:584 length:252 start_codon:yes stop_codon:yes gene_type:complete